MRIRSFISVFLFARAMSISGKTAGMYIGTQISRTLGFSAILLIRDVRLGPLLAAVSFRLALFSNFAQIYQAGGDVVTRVNPI